MRWYRNNQGMMPVWIKNFEKKRKKIEKKNRKFEKKNFFQKLFFDIVCQNDRNWMGNSMVELRQNYRSWFSRNRKNPIFLGSNFEISGPVEISTGQKYLTSMRNSISNIFIYHVILISPIFRAILSNFSPRTISLTGDVSL